MIAPALREGQAVVFSPGNLGAVILREELEAAYSLEGGMPDVLVAEHHFALSRSA